MGEPVSGAREAAAHMGMEDASGLGGRKPPVARNELAQLGAAPALGRGQRPLLNRHILAATLLASISSGLLGYDVGVTSGALLFIQEDFGLSVIQQEVFVSSLSLVSLVGALISGRLSDAIGRRLTIACASAVFLAGALLMALAPSFGILLLGRLVTGVGVGFGFTVAPLYTAELAPPSHRGMLVSFTEVFINMGILVGYLASFALQSLPEGTNWRWMLGLAVLPALALGLGVLAMPESPRWLILKGRSAEALEVLEKTSTEPGESAQRLAEIMEAAGLPPGAGSSSAPAHALGGEWERARPYEQRSRDGLLTSSRARGFTPWGVRTYQPVKPALPEEHLPASSAGGGATGRERGLLGTGGTEGGVRQLPGLSDQPGVCGRGVWRELLRPSPAVQRMLLLCIGTNFFQQATGIDAAVYYSPVVFKQAGIHGKTALLGATLAVGVAKASFVIAAMLLLDHFGRRPLLLLSTTGMTLSLLGLSLGFLLLRQQGEMSGQGASWLAGGGAFAPALTVSAVCSFVAAFSLGMGPINWLLTVEIFPLRLRAQAFALGTAVNRLASGTVALTFLSLGGALSPAGCFLLFACISAASVLFFYIYAPETKGKTLEEIASLFEQREEIQMGLLAAEQSTGPGKFGEEAQAGSSLGGPGVDRVKDDASKAHSQSDGQQTNPLLTRLKSSGHRGDSSTLWG